MLTTLRIIHPPSSDNPTSLPVIILSVDGQKFLFNVPEGTSRVLAQRGYRGANKKLNGILVPRVGYDECGGLFGLLMTLADEAKGKINLYGTPTFSQFLCTGRMYAGRENLQVTVNECDLTKGKSEWTIVMYKDKNVTIEAIPVFPDNFTLPDIGSDLTNSTPDRPVKKQRKAENGFHQQNHLSPSIETQRMLQSMYPYNAKNAFANEDNLLQEKRHQNYSNRFQPMKPPSLSPVKLTNANDGQAPALTYIVKCSSVRGRFDVKKAKEMGVPHPSYYSKITENIDVEISRPKDWSGWDENKRKAWFKRQSTLIQSQNGKPKKSPQQTFEDDLGEVETEKVTIYSKDLLAPSIPGTTFVQLYLPSIDYLESFFSSETQVQFDGLEEQMHCMVHAVHPDILNEKRYQDFVKRFPNAHHYISSRPYIPDKLTYSSFALGMLRLSKIDSNLFKVPQYSLLPQKSLKEIGLDMPNVRPVGPETSIQLQPKKEPESETGYAPEFDFPIDSPQAETIASFHDEPRTPSQAALFARGRQKWPRYLELITQVQEEELQNGSHTMTLDSEPKRELDDLAITTLGTGSAMPSKHRNVSSALIHLPGDEGYILLDAGENTYAQLSRKFGKDVDTVLRNIRLVFLSHAHGDHHMGIAKVLMERKRLEVDRPLFVLSNFVTRLYLQEVNDIVSLDICTQEESANAKRGVIFLDSEDFDSWHGVRSDSLAENSTKEGKEEEMYTAFIKRKSRNQMNKGSSSPILSNRSDSETEVKVTKAAQETIQKRSKMRQAAKAQYSRLQENIFGTQIFTTEVRHRGGLCYGIILRGKGWSLAFSGDTMPCQRFIDAGKGVDILLHEATFENGEELNASIKRHSTIGQAIKVAKKMKAKRLALTHFSQRYPHLPNSSLAALSEEMDSSSDSDGDNFEPAVGISFDLMTFRANDIGKTEKYREAMQLLFDVDEHESDDGGDDENGDGSAGQSAINGAEEGSKEKEGKMKASKETNKDEPSKEDDEKAKTLEGKRSGPSGEAKKAKKEESFQSKYVKNYEFAYLVSHIVPRRRTAGKSESDSKTLAISQLLFDDCIRKSLEDLHGIVGGSFERDLVFFDRPPNSSDEHDNSILAIIKVATPFAQQLASVIASGVEMKSNKGELFITRYGGILSAFDLPSALTMVGPSGRTIQPPGRAWMQSMIEKR